MDDTKYHTDRVRRTRLNACPTWKAVKGRMRQMTTSQRLQRLAKYLDNDEACSAARYRPYYRVCSYQDRAGQVHMYLDFLADQGKIEAVGLLWYDWQRKPTKPDWSAIKVLEEE